MWSKKIVDYFLLTKFLKSDNLVFETRCIRRKNLKGIKLGNKESKYPIIQGGMGVGVSMHRLAGFVSKEGGIGIISTADIGYKEPEFKNNSKSCRDARKSYL